MRQSNKANSRQGGMFNNSFAITFSTSQQPLVFPDVRGPVTIQYFLDRRVENSRGPNRANPINNGVTKSDRKGIPLHLRIHGYTTLVSTGRACYGKLEVPQVLGWSRDARQTITNILAYFG